MLRSVPTRRLAPLVLLCIAGCAGIYFAARAGGALPALLAAIAVVCAIALVAQTERNAAEAIDVTQAFDTALLFLPGALIVYFAFNAGGYFPNAPAAAALALILIGVLRLTLADDPFAAFSPQLALAAGALGLFAVWVLASGSWSHSTALALVEFDRAFMYLLVLVIMGSVVRTGRRLRWLASGLAAGCLVVSVTALATRLAPDVFPTSIPAIGESNLAYPLTYSNALGIICVLGAILAFYFGTSTRLPRLARAAGCAALPVFAVTVYLTLSRGPVAAAMIGFAAFVLLGRPRGLLTGLAAALPTSVVAIASAYQHSVLTSKDPQAAIAAAQGHTVAIVVAGCVLAAFVIRVVLTPLDDRVRDYHLPPNRRRAVVVAGWTAAGLVVLIALVALNLPAKVHDQYDRFVSTGQAAPTQTDVRQSVFSSANRGIVDNWRVALDGFDAAPLHGQGAASYANYWLAHRPARQAGYDVVDAHSLYAEVLGELGLVGGVLLAVLVLTVLGGLLPYRRGENRPLYAALFATALAWAVHAGIDWDWEMPAVTISFFALGGAALATHRRDAHAFDADNGLRIIASLLLLAAAVTPALLFASQRQLNDARDALRASDCRHAIARATDSITTLEIRPEPYELLALCQQQRGNTGLAIEAMRHATKRDPENWKYHYELGTLQGGFGQDPRRELFVARRLNPHNAALNTLLRSIPKGESINWDLELQGPGGATVGQR